MFLLAQAHLAHAACSLVLPAQRHVYRVDAAAEVSVVHRLPVKPPLLAVIRSAFSFSSLMRSLVNVSQLQGPQANQSSVKSGGHATPYIIPARKNQTISERQQDLDCVSLSTVLVLYLSQPSDCSSRHTFMHSCTAMFETLRRRSSHLNVALSRRRSRAQSCVMQEPLHHVICNNSIRSHGRGTAHFAGWDFGICYNLRLPGFTPSDIMEVQVHGPARLPFVHLADKAYECAFAWADGRHQGRVSSRPSRNVLCLLNGWASIAWR